MATSIIGRRFWGGNYDKDGYIEYKVTHLIRAAKTDGPYNVLHTAGLPLAGSTWNFGADVDPTAYCKVEKTATPTKVKGANYFWEVEQTFSNKGDPKFCKDTEISNPLLQPQKVSGGFTKGKEEGRFDRFGERILTSSHEEIHGPENQWDDGRPNIKIEQNVAILNLALLVQMIDTVNDSIMWGLPPRTIKLDSITWERKFYGSCFVYYTRTFEFGVRYKRIKGVDFEQIGTSTALGEVFTEEYETYDRDIVDLGTKVIKGTWNRTTGVYVIGTVNGSPADPTDPRHFIRYQDINGNVTKVILDGEGAPAGKIVGTGTGTGRYISGPGEIHVEKYGQSNMFLLGIPAIIEV